MNITPTVKQLLIINVIFFAGTQMVGDAAYTFLSLFYPEHPDFRIWQPLTHMFMHGNVMHILFNMFALYSFGSALEQFWGGKKFLFFYISCGLGAALLHTAVNFFQVQSAMSALTDAGLSQQSIESFLTTGRIQYDPGQVEEGVLQSLFDAFNTPAVGASGAIYGLLVAFAFMFPNTGLMLIFVPVPIKAKYFVPGLLIIDLFLGITGKSIFGGGSGIAHFAHIGGALVGFLMMWYWKKSQFNRNRWN